jgi:hypothetical protein
VAHGFEKFDMIAALETVQEQLAEAQREILITHEFTERQYYINRNIISSFIATVNEQLIESHINTWAEMFPIMEEVDEFIDSLEENDCVDRVRNIWELQKVRHGHFLSQCMRQAYAEVWGWSNFTDSLHEETSWAFNHLPNLALIEMGEREAFDNNESWYTAINRRLRIILADNRNYMNTFEEFRVSVMEDDEEVVRQLTECDRRLIPTFRFAADRELLRGYYCTYPIIGVEPEVPEV